ncbi:MAG: lipoate--protein ligase [Malacoplasma sp.]
MKIYRLNSNNPYFNLATEEYFLKENNEDVILIWQNDNAIIIGRNQNAYSEINNIYVNENDIKVVRRISGGGAVYHDTGNVNFTIILRNRLKNFSMQNFLIDIIEFLHSMNIDAKFSGRNDILLFGKKISGVASTTHNNDVLVHGTLLYNLNIEKLVNSLNVNKLKIDSKGIDSVRARVCNISEHLTLTLEEFINKLLYFLEQKYKTLTHVFDKSNSFIDDAYKNKFSTYEWNFGKNFDFNFENKFKNEHGIYHVQLEINDGVINKIKLFTDSLMNEDFTLLENILTNQKYEIKHIKSILLNNKEILSSLKLAITFVITLLFKNS